MKDTNLGGFEELVLLSIGTLTDDAYSISIKNALEDYTERAPSIGALHSALMRLEEKGFISSYEGGASKERGGRRKRFYTMSKKGLEALIHAKELRQQFYTQIPVLKLT
ncbi:MAG: PadR family transcriptional regulator [Cyclobacteriaceae bacterium]